MTLARISSRARSEGTIRPRATDARKPAFQVPLPMSKQSRIPINSDHTRALIVVGLLRNQGLCPMIRAEGRAPAAMAVRGETRHPRQAGLHGSRSCKHSLPEHSLDHSRRKPKLEGGVAEAEDLALGGDAGTYEGREPPVGVPDGRAIELVTLDKQLDRERPGKPCRAGPGAGPRASLRKKSPTSTSMLRRDRET